MLVFSFKDTLFKKKKKVSYTSWVLDMAAMWRAEYGLCAADQTGGSGESTERSPSTRRLARCPIPNRIRRENRYGGARGADAARQDAFLDLGLRIMARLEIGGIDFWSRRDLWRTARVQRTFWNEHAEVVSSPAASKAKARAKWKAKAKIQTKADHLYKKSIDQRILYFV